MVQPGFFDLDERYQRLSENGDPLVKLAALIDFEAFRPKLATALKRSDGSKGGRPPYDAVLMFKVLILQTLYTLSDDATEFQIRDRLSFMRFLGLGFEDAVPDAKTVWLFREQLTRAGAIDDLFAAFDAWLKGKGYLAMSGQIIDASIIAAPRQRNTDAEKAALREGKIPDAWAARPKKLAQKDRDARWTLKRAKARAAKADGTKAKVEIAVPVFGYKRPRNTASVCSCAPSAWPEPGRKSGSPTSPTTSSASSGSKPGRWQPDPGPGRAPKPAHDTQPDRQTADRSRQSCRQRQIADLTIQPRGSSRCPIVKPGWKLIIRQTLRYTRECRGHVDRVLYDSRTHRKFLVDVDYERPPRGLGKFAVTFVEEVSCYFEAGDASYRGIPVCSCNLVHQYLLPLTRDETVIRFNIEGTPF